MQNPPGQRPPGPGLFESVGRARSARLSGAALLALACGSSTAEEVESRYGIANQIAGSRPGAAGSMPTGQAGAGMGGTTGSNTAGSGGTGGAPAIPPPMPAVPAAPDAPSGPAQECNGPNIASGVFGTPAPPDGTLLDFDTYTPRTATGGGAWGDMGLGQITGGTSLYSGDAASALTLVVEDGELHLSARLGALRAYTGIVLWFAPCVNASAFGGLTFPIAGELGGAQLLVKPQASPNYPVDVSNSKGKCTYPREDMKFTTCQQPTATISELSASPLTLGWAEFVDGAPVEMLDSAQLLGLELQFQCTPGNCAFDIRVGDIRFTAP